MKLQGYSVSILGGSSETSEGYVSLRDGQHFKIDLYNDTDERCLASVMVNGKHQGDLVLESRTRYNPLERGTKDTGKFTFYKLGTSNAELAGLPDSSQQDTGLIQVTFKPELRRAPRLPDYGRPMSSRGDYTLGGFRGGDDGMSRGALRGGGGGATRSYSAGGVGLSGRSEQRFGTTSFTEDPDSSKYVTISLRLICDDSAVQEDGPRPLAGNKVPPPLL